jgi:hypothetical protein
MNKKAVRDTFVIILLNIIPVVAPLLPSMLENKKKLHQYAALLEKYDKNTKQYK